MTDNKKLVEDIKKLNFEEALKALEEIVQELDSGSIDLDKAVDSILAAAKTGRIGDGKIFISDLEKVIRIRTGETDNKAI